MEYEALLDIDQVLEGYHIDALAAMARASDLLADDGARRPRKAWLKEMLQNNLFRPERVAAALAQLGARERAMLDRLLLRGGEARESSLRREAIRAKLVREAPQPAGQTGHVGGMASFDQILARLTSLGLVFSRHPNAATGPLPKLTLKPTGVLFVPEAIAAYLPTPEPLPATIVEPGTVGPAQPGLLLRDLYLYWDYIRRNEVPLTQAGLVYKRSLRAINGILLEPDPNVERARSERETHRLFLLRGLLHALGLVEEQVGRLCVTGGGALDMPSFWGKPQAQQTAACLAVWTKWEDESELGDRAASFGAQYTRAREALINALASMPENRWIEVEDLVEQIVARDLDFLFPDHSKIEASTQSWYYIYHSGYISGQRDGLLSEFEAFELAFITGSLAGFLRQCGIVDLGYHGETLTAFRITPAGKALLRGDPQAPAALGDEVGRVVVQPNFQILAMGPVGLDVLARIEQFADRERAGLGAFEYTLSRESLYRAQQMGADTEEIVRFLEEVSAAELPQNVRRSLSEWAARHERIVFRSGVSLLQAATPELLQALLAGPEINSLLARQVAPDAALIDDNQADDVLKALLAQGILPAISSSDPSSADGSVIMDDDGTIRPIHAVPSLHLPARLSRWAEEMPAQNGAGRTWRVTPASLRQAGGSRSRVLTVLDEMAALQRGPLPEALVEKVKAWGGYYGSAAVETLTLIEFRDRDALAELCKLPELVPLLKPFPAGNRALAVVESNRLGEVEAILARLGVPVRTGLST